MSADLHECAFLEKLEMSRTSEDILRESKVIFDYYHSQFKKNNNIVEEVINSKVSHVKELLFAQKTSLGQLKVEVIYFGNKVSTGLHIHPEFIIDEIFYGGLVESVYKKTSDGIHHGPVFSPLKTERRLVGDYRISYDMDGLPHDVIGIEDINISLCLSLGKKPMEMVEFN